MAQIQALHQHHRVAPCDGFNVCGREYTAHRKPCHLEGMSRSLTQANKQGPRFRCALGGLCSIRAMQDPKSKPTDKAQASPSPTSSSSALPSPLCHPQFSPLHSNRPSDKICLGAAKAVMPAQTTTNTQALHTMVLVAWLCHCQAESPAADNNNAPPHKARAQTKRPTGKATGGALCMRAA
jgi:hypothetical protein